jgi:hypothetical protein
MISFSSLVLGAEYLVDGIHSVCTSLDFSTHQAIFAGYKDPHAERTIKFFYSQPSSRILPWTPPPPPSSTIPTPISPTSLTSTSEPLPSVATSPEHPPMTSPVASPSVPSAPSPASPPPSPKASLSPSPQSPTISPSPTLVPRSRGGVFLGHYHSAHQAAIFAAGGFDAIFTKYISPFLSSPSPIDFCYWYPHSTNRRPYSFLDIYYSSDYERFSNSIASYHHRLLTYIPLPTDDLFTNAPVDVPARLGMLPASSSIVVDSLHSLPRLGVHCAVAIQNFFRIGAPVIAENWWPTYNSMWWSNPILINQDEYLRHLGASDRLISLPPSRPPVTVSHYDPRLYTEDHTREARVARLSAFTLWCYKQGFNWLVPAEVLVSGNITLAEITPSPSTASPV